MFVIPMAGLSSRFFKAGFKVPKYQLLLNEQLVFDLALQSFKSYFDSDLFVLIVRDVYDTPQFVTNRLKALGVKNFIVHTLTHETQGQAHTVALGLDNVTIRDDEPVYIFNIDTFRYGFKKPELAQAVAGYLEVFRGEGEHWSFIAVDEANNVIRTTEKQRISNLCSDGMYYFASKALYLELFEQAQQTDLTVNGELYIAPMYNLLIERGDKVGYVEIADIDIDFCGTPDEYQNLVLYGLKQPM